MKILFVTAQEIDSDSSANIGNKALVRALVKMGHSVTTISRVIFPEYYNSNGVCDVQLDKRYCINDIKQHQDESSIKRKTIVSIIRKSKIFHWIFMLLYKNVYLKWRIYDSSKKVIKEAKHVKINEKFDLMISSSDLKISHLLAEKLLKWHPNICKKWVQYWGDPFANDINKINYVPYFIMAREEKRILSKCDKIIYVSPFTLIDQQKRFKSLKDKMLFFPLPYIKETIHPKHKNKQYTVGYFGDYHINTRNILPLYKTFKDTQTDQLMICGNTDIKLASTDHITINERIPYDEMAKIEEQCDLLVCICNRKGKQVPGKPSQCARTNKPILIILDGENATEIKNYFASYNRFYFCRNNVESIKRTINRIKLNKKEYKPCKQLSGDYITEKILGEIYKQ